MKSLIQTTSTILALGLLAGACADTGEDPMMDRPARPAATHTKPADTRTPAIEGERMTGAQINRRLVGRELVARNIDTGTVNVVWLTPDKRIKWVKGDRITFGRWGIEGNRLCFRYEDPGRDKTCSEIYRQGPKRYVSVRDGKPVTRIEIEK